MKRIVPEAPVLTTVNWNPALIGGTVKVTVDVLLIKKTLLLSDDVIVTDVPESTEAAAKAGAQASIAVLIASALTNAVVELDKVV